MLIVRTHFLSLANPPSVLQDMLRSWSEPFREAHGHRPDVRWYELSLVESVVSHPGSSFLPHHTLTMKART